MLEYDMNSQDQKTDSLEVFFAGCHCDIGGGSGECINELFDNNISCAYPVQNHIRHSLARYVSALPFGTLLI
jgi:hypothetical protein